MKTRILLLAFVLLCNISYSQTNFKYSYDAAGNRIKRELTSAIRAMAAEVQTDSISSDLSENQDAFPTVLYPNPTSGYFTVELPDFQEGEKGNIMIHDQMGKIFAQQRYVSSTQNFNISSVPSGFYIVRIIVNDKLVIKKIIKK